MYRQRTITTDSSSHSFYPLTSVRNAPSSQHGPNAMTPL